MRRWILGGLVSLLIAACLPASTPPAQAQSAASLSIGIMRGELSAHGAWFDHPRYGTAWRPRGLAAGWRPYTNGRWAWTDEHGWVWVSYYNWGWLAFHYGRWGYDPGYGWFWVPGYEWAPAWVAWRTGNGVVGWFPLPPDATFDPGTGYFYGGPDIYGEYYRPYWVFVQDQYFLTTVLLSVIIHPRYYWGFRTRRARGYWWYRNRYIHRGVSRGRIERATGRRVRAAPVRVINRRGDLRRPRPGDRTVRIYRPSTRRARVTPGPGAAPRYTPPGRRTPRFVPPTRRAPRTAPPQRRAPRYTPPRTRRYTPPRTRRAPRYVPPQRRAPRYTPPRTRRYVPPRTRRTPGYVPPQRRAPRYTPPRTRRYVPPPRRTPRYVPPRRRAPRTAPPRTRRYAPPRTRRAPPGPSPRRRRYWRR